MRKRLKVADGDQTLTIEKGKGSRWSKRLKVADQTPPIDSDNDVDDDEGDSDTNDEANADDETNPDDKPDPADNYSRIDSQTDLAEATPLLFAARSGDVDALRLLLEDGADPLAVTKGGNTALTLAAGVVFHEGGQGQGEGPPKADALEAVQLLLALGCDVNARNERGQTALHGAVYRAANDLIRFLVANGAKMDAEDARGRTPLELAEIGPNQGASRIRRDAAAALLRELGG